MKLSQLPVAGLVLLMALAVTAAPARLYAQSGATDPAYVAGYNAGYPLGQRDQRQGMAANAHKFSVYQQADAGYTPDYGTRAAWRASFRSGFDDGYGDGYGGRPRSVMLAGNAPPPSAAGAPAAAPPTSGSGVATPPVLIGGAGAPAAAPESAEPAGPSPELVKTARANGYREGYNIGQSDADSNAVYNATVSREYRDANIGYTAALGSSADYQEQFRRGFAAGYDDGFNHRLYNSAEGARTAPPAPAPPVSAGSNDLPRNAARMASLPSGVYDNGILVAQGTQLQTTLDNELDTKHSYSGEAFTLTTTVPIWVGSVAAIPAGSKIEGIVENIKRGGKLSGHAQIQLQYNTLTLPGQTPIALNGTTAAVGAAAQNVNSNEGTVNGQGPNTAKHVATGAAIGAVLGGIFGGGLLRGGLAGAAVGTAGVLISHKKDITLREGEQIMVRLDQPLELPKVATGD
jgi:hypothetical protein